MNLFKYFFFYYRLLGFRLLVFLFTAISAAFLQAMALAAFMGITNYGNQNPEKASALVRHVLAIVHYFGFTEPNDILLVLLSFCSVTFFISTAALVGALWYSAHLESNLMVELQKEMVKKLFRGKYEYFLTHSIGFLNNVVVHEMGKVSSSFKFYSNIFISSMFVVSFMMVSVFTSLTVTVIVGFVGVPLLFVFKFINKKLKYYAQANTLEIGTLYGYIYQILGHFKYLKATNVHHVARKKLGNQAEKYARVVRMQALWGSMSIEGPKPFVVTLLGVIVFIQVVYQGRDMSESLMLMATLYLCYQKAISLQGSYQKFLHSSGGIMIYEKIHSELDNLVEKLNLKDGKEPDFTQKMEFKNLFFKYSKQNDYVLKNINLTIEPNSTVAFVGGSGAGKSTVVNLIAALLEPEKGDILLSGVSYKELNLEKLRNGMGYVTQEPVVFNDTILNNITLWEPERKNEAEDAGKKAHAHEFISEKENAYECMLGDDGLNISGGQRQRITIARELFRNTPMLIFDEATSSLDSETEQLIQKSIDEAHGEKTIIIIAHRLSTVKNADCIYVLDKGQIVESGTYAELCSKGGKFSEMVNLQGNN
jgi:subfamily B ATP-binding cassette protein MsbA